MRTRRAARRRDAARRPLIGDRVELLSARDYRTHYVEDIVYGVALAERAGHCRAVCGHDVVLCAMITPPGPLCRACADAP